MIFEKAEARPLCGEGWGIVLRIPDGTEAAAADVAGRGDVALRRAAVVGVVGPDAAAHQTVRTSRGPCGVCHAP